jgi:hypothetical protein
MNSLILKLLQLKYLADATVNIDGNTYNTNLSKVNASGVNGTNDVQVILQIVFGAIGAIALIIILIAALQFITSSGDAQETARARSTLIYAAVGLILALSAEVIVTFVLTNI